MTVDVRQLQLFVAVAEELHFRRAARRMGLTQPALSHQIAQLEERLEVRLFDRSSRHVELTAAGRTLLDGARRVLSEVQRTVDDTRRVGGASEKRLVLGYVEYMNIPFLATALRALGEKHPDVVVEHRELYSTEAVAALAERTIDVGFVWLPIDQPNLVARQVIEGEWIVILPEDHRLAVHEEIPTKELAGEPLILFARHLNPPLADIVDEKFRAAGFEPRVVYRTAQALLGPTLVAEGLGLFVCGSYVPRELPAGVTMRRISGFDPIRIAAAWRSDNASKALRTFREILPKKPVAPKPRPANGVHHPAPHTSSPGLPKS